MTTTTTTSNLRSLFENNPTACCECNVTMYYEPLNHAEACGHVYSEEGAAEALNISGTCEYCWDRMFGVLEWWDEDEY